jgi:hypothetical protein
MARKVGWTVLGGLVLVGALVVVALQVRARALEDVVSIWEETGKDSASREYSAYWGSCGLTEGLDVVGNETYFRVLTGMTVGLASPLLEVMVDRSARLDSVWVPFWAQDVQDAKDALSDLLRELTANIKEQVRLGAELSVSEGDERFEIADDILAAGTAARPTTSALSELARRQLLAAAGGRYSERIDAQVAPINCIAYVPAIERWG